jgi:hypothetical protein
VVNKFVIYNADFNGVFSDQMLEHVTAPYSGLVAYTSTGFDKTYARLTLEKMSISSQIFFKVFEYIYTEN